MITNKFNLLDTVKFSCSVRGDEEGVFTFITSTGEITGFRIEKCCSIIYTVLCDEDGDYYESFEGEMELLEKQS